MSVDVEIPDPTVIPTVVLTAGAAPLELPDPATFPTVIVDWDDGSTTVFPQNPLVDVDWAGAGVSVLPPPAIVQLPIGVGVEGPPGPEGGSSFIVFAGADLSGHRVVRPQGDGTVVYASNSDLADATRPLWLTLGAALSGDPVTVQGLGLITEPSWNWSDAPIFLGVDGVLTQTPPALPAAFLLQLGAPDGATSLYYQPRTPIALS